MKITLINIPVLTEQGDYAAVRRLLVKSSSIYSSPQIGILVVASLFRNEGWDVNVVDINKHYEEHLKSGRHQDSFCDDFACYLSDMDSDFFGFSSICSSFHFTLKIAEIVKLKSRNSKIILGGPQATATSNETFDENSYIDYLLSGEVEYSIADFVRYHNSTPEKIKNLMWRDCQGVHYNQIAPATAMEDVPTPAYDLWDMSSIEVIHIEGGRGCPFNCKFCSTNTFFGRNYRLKQIADLVDETASLVEAYEIDSVTYIHDNLFVKQKDCIEFCRSWRQNAKLNKIHWNCSLRVEIISESLAKELAEANCSGVFLGIESGSWRIQSIINKKINPKAAKNAVNTLNRNGIHTTASFIIGFPEETESDLEETLCFYSDMLRLPYTKPQASVLAVLPKSGYDEDSIMSLHFTGGISSMAHQGSTIPRDLLQIIKSSPKLFSSHHAPMLVNLDREFVNECENFLKYVTGLYRWLIVAALDFTGITLKTLLDLWWSHVRTLGNQGKGFSYYSGSSFRRDLDAFMSNLAKQSSFDEQYRDIYDFLCDAYGSKGVNENLKRFSLSNIEENQNTAKSKGPVAVNKSKIQDAEYSFRNIVEALSGRRKMQSVKPGKYSLVSYIDKEELVLEEPTLITEAILRSIGTKSRVSEVVGHLVSEYENLLPSDIEVKTEVAFTHALELLNDQGLIEFQEA